MKSLLFVSAVITTYMCYVRGQSTCTPPTGGAGQCISIYECDPLLALVNKPTRSPEDLDILKSSQCGFAGSTPKVCCPVPCYTADWKEGKCIGIYSCPHVTKMLQPPVSKESLAFVHNSKCNGPEQYSVCCGPANTGAVQPTGVCTPSALPVDPRTECCGADNSAGNRIVGGNATSVDQYPWLTIIEYLKDNKIKLLCGGALISGKYVLTAGHCVVGPVLNSGIPTNVRLGEYDTGHDGNDCVPVEGGDGAEDCTEGAVIIPIERIIAHPDYQPKSSLKRHDIALIRLKQLAPYTDFIRPICLPTMDNTVSPPDPFRLFAAGWGATNLTTHSSTVKLHVELPFQSYEVCQPSYNTNGRRVPLWKGQLCAGGVKGKDSCKGDSGGPLMFENGKTFEVVGIVSFGPLPCGMENVPGVYTKVYEYNTWIRNTIRL